MPKQRNERAYNLYLESDSWKCKKSPTGGHSWLTNAKETIKTCIHCEKKVNLEEVRTWVQR